MTQAFTRYFGAALTFIVIAASVAILNVTPASTAAAECGETSTGGGGGQSASPSGSSTPSPSESDEGPLPVPIPPIGEDEESSTPTGSSTSPPGGGGGGEEPQRCKTKLTISSERTRASSAAVSFKGKVKSENSDCQPGRKIALKKKKKGKDRTVGNTISKRNGSWTIKEPRARGRFYAKAAKRKVGTVTCLPGRSKTIKA